MTTSYTEPFDIARRLASLDLISGGRAGWNTVTSYDSGTAGNFSRADHGDHAHRYRRGAEAVTVVQGLWNSCEDGAFASDKDAVSYLDTARLHRLDHEGEFFSVTGPLNIQRSRQGQPVIIQAGTSEPGRDLNARFAELAFSFAKTAEWALAFAADVRARAATHGRNTDDILFVPALSVRVRDTDEQAQAAELEALERRPLARQLDRFQRQYPAVDFSSLESRFLGRSPRGVVRTLVKSVSLATCRGSDVCWSIRSGAQSAVTRSTTPRATARGTRTDAVRCASVVRDRSGVICG